MPLELRGTTKKNLQHHVRSVSYCECVVPENYIHTHPKEGSWKFQGAGGVSKTKFFKGKFDTKMEFPEGVGGSS